MIAQAGLGLGTKTLPGKGEPAGLNLEESDLLILGEVEDLEPGIGLPALNRPGIVAI